MLDIEIYDTLDNIFSGICIGEAGDAKARKWEIYNQCITAFINQFPYNIFENEYALLYDIIRKLNVKVFTLEQLDLIIDNNENLITQSNLINLDQWDSQTLGAKLNLEEKLLLFKKMVKDKYVNLCQKEVTLDDFESSLKLFLDYYIEKQSLQVAQNMTMISKSGIKLKTLDGKLRNYVGTEGRDAYYAENKKILDSLKGSAGVHNLVVDDEWLKAELEKEMGGEEESLLETGLPPIDDVTGPLRRSNVLGILGPPKGGKTKFANYMTARALASGLNVAVWVLEGTRDEWLAMQIANIVRNNGGDSLNSNDILNRRYNNDNIVKQQVLGAKAIMANGQGRGKLSFIEGTAYVETFIETIKTHYRCENQFDVLVIDSLVNVQSLTGRQKVDRISEAFMLTKDLVAHQLAKPVLGILTAQLKQSTIDHLRSHPDETMDVTAGGESAETIRTPDIIYGLFSSKEERKENKTHLYCVGSRHSEAFDDFISKCELNCAYFEYDPDEDL